MSKKKKQYSVSNKMNECHDIVTFLFPFFSGLNVFKREDSWIQGLDFDCLDLHRRKKRRKNEKKRREKKKKKEREGRESTYSFSDNPLHLFCFSLSSIFSILTSSSPVPLKKGRKRERRKEKDSACSWLLTFSAEKLWTRKRCRNSSLTVTLFLLSFSSHLSLFILFLFPFRKWERERESFPNLNLLPTLNTQ